MMPGLIRLLQLKWYATGRRMLRSVTTVRGAIMFLMGLLLFSGWLASTMYVARDQRPDLETTRLMAPFFLLMICTTNIFFSSQERSIQFQASEMDFLFSAPVTRRQLLLYKLLSSLPGLFFASMIMSVVFLRYLPKWHFAFVGCFVMLVFVMLFTTSIALVAQFVAAKVFNWTRKLVLAGIIAAAAVALVPLWNSSDVGSLTEFVDYIRQSSLVVALLSPFQLFGNLLTATTAMDCARFVWPCLLVNLGMFLLVLYLDANFLEASLQFSRRLYRRAQQARRSGVAFPVGKARFSLPRLPHWRGAGPVAWRQLTNAWRRSKAMLLTSIAVVVIAALVGGGQLTDGSAGLMILVIPSVLFVQSFPFDFRSDVDRLERFKAMPIGPLALTIGQLTVPVLILSVIQLLLVGIVVIVRRSAPPMMWTVAPFSLPLNILLLALENLLFLLFPSRLTAAMPGDFQFMGRTMLIWIVKLLVIGVVAVIAAMVAGLVFTFSGGSQLAAVATAWVVAISIALGLLPCVAWAYARFDVSRQLPD